MLPTIMLAMMVDKVYSFPVAFPQEQVAGSSDNQSSTQSDSGYPQLSSDFFSDSTGIIDAEARDSINRDMRNALQRSRIHVVLAVIKRMSDYPKLPQTIDKFSEQLAEHWKIGEKKNKLGILVLFSIEDKKFFVAKTKEMSTRLTDDIKAGLMDRPRQSLRRGLVPLAMRQAANVLAERVPAFESESGAANLVGKSSKTPRRTNRKYPPFDNQPGNNQRNVEPERQQGRAGGGGILAGLVCVGFVLFLVVGSVVGIAISASRGFGRSVFGSGTYQGRRNHHYGRGNYDGGYFGGHHGAGSGGGFMTGMIAGGLLGSMFGGRNHGWGSGSHHDVNQHTGGGFFGGGDGGGFSGGDGGGFDAADTFGGGDFDGGSFGEW